MRSALRGVQQGVVAEHKGSHGFDDWHGSWQHAGIVTAAAFQFGVFVIATYGLLFGHDSRRRLKGCAEANVFSIGNTTLDTAGAVAASSYRFTFHIKRIIMLSSGELSTAEA